MVDADGQIVGVGEPEVVEEDLGLCAGVVKDERRAVALHFREDFLDGIAPAAARPRRRCLGAEHGDIGIGAGIGLKNGAGRPATGHEGGKGGRVFDGGGKPHAPQARRHGLKPRQPQHQLIAPFAFGKGVNLVDNHAAQARKHPRRILVGGEKRERLRRCQKNMRWIDPLAFLACGAGVASPVLDADRQTHLADRHEEVAADVRGERLEGRDIERVQPLARFSGQLGQCRQEPRQRLAAACGRDEHERGLTRTVEHFPLVRMHLPAAGGEPV